MTCPTNRQAHPLLFVYSGTSWQETWRETTPGDLVNRFTSIVRALAKAAPPIAAQVAEVRRKAEEEHARWLVQHEARLREERARKEQEAREEHERKRLAARKTSRDDLIASIGQWAWTRRVEEFFAEIDHWMNREAPEDHAALEERIALARAMVGETNALQRFRAWKSPEERYPGSQEP